MTVMIMKHYVPQFYKDFKCAASKCSDTCCKDWEIVIDDQTQALYNNVSGKLGNMLKSNIVTDSDGDRIFRLGKNHECPFLDNDRLCMIQKELGANALCRTCFAFPKLTLDYTEFTEYALSFACPEAVRYIMKSDSYSVPEASPVSDENNGYSNNLMNFLIAARRYTAGIFMSDLPYSEKIANALAYTDYVQELLYTGNIDISLLYDVEFTLPESTHSDKDFVFELFSQLDIMDKDFVRDIRQASHCEVFSGEEFDGELSKQSLYYLHRYYLNAVDSEDVLSCVKSIYCAYAIVSSLVSFYGAENHPDRRISIFEKYSREVEHSAENIDTLTEAFFTSPDFSTINLLNTI